MYEAFPEDVKLEDGTLDDGGFCLYLYSESLAPGENSLEVVTKDDQGYNIIYSQTFEPGE